MFLTCVIKVDKREVLRSYFKHICVVWLFLDFPEKLPLCRKGNDFGSYPFFDSLDQANLICFWHMSSTLIIQKYFDYLLNIFMCFSCF